MNKKYFFIILSIIFIASVFFIWQKGYFYNDQGLDTYRNDKYSFELKYPEDWSVSDNNGEIRIFSDNDAATTQNCKEKEQELIDQNVAFGPTGCKFGIFINILARQEIEDYYDVWSLYIISNDTNTQAFQLNRDYLSADFAIAVPLPEDDKFILLEIYNTVDAKEISNQIIPTLEFLNK